MNIFKLWMRAATRAEQDLLAQRAGTTQPHLYQLSGEHRQASPTLGASIERVSSDMHKASNGRLPRIYRTDLVEACRQCEFAQKCLGPAAVRADFPIVTADSMTDSEGGSHD